VGIWLTDFTSDDSLSTFCHAVGVSLDHLKEQGGQVDRHGAVRYYVEKEATIAQHKVTVLRRFRGLWQSISATVPSTPGDQLARIAYLRHSLSWSAVEAVFKAAIAMNAGLLVADQLSCRSMLEQLSTSTLMLLELVALPFDRVSPSQRRECLKLIESQLEGEKGTRPDASGASDLGRICAELLQGIPQLSYTQIEGTVVGGRLSLSSTFSPRRRSSVQLTNFPRSDDSLSQAINLQFSSTWIKEAAVVSTDPHTQHNHVEKDPERVCSVILDSLPHSLLVTLQGSSASLEDHHSSWDDPIQVCCLRLHGESRRWYCPVLYIFSAKHSHQCWMRTSKWFAKTAAQGHVASAEKSGQEEHNQGSDILLWWKKEPTALLGAIIYREIEIQSTQSTAG
jgi:hypothetical protein